MEFKLPDIGEGVHEGEITKWLIQPGEKLTADQPMVEVMTDKATVEIPAPIAGTVEALFAKEGDTVQVGKVILKITEGGKTAAAAPAKAAPKAEAPATQAKAAAPLPQKTAAPAPASEAQHEEVEVPFNVLATPATRKLARDLEINLGKVTGSGPHGRVTKEDVQTAYEGKGSAPARPATPVAGGMQAKAPASKIAFTPGTDQRLPLKGIRKKIAEAMSHSKHTAAHFTYVEEVDMTEIVKLRTSAAEEAKQRGVKLTFLPFILKALVPALRDFPYLNASLDDAKQEIVVKGSYNIGIATDTANGLMVPVVKHVDQKNIWDIASEIATLSDKAKAGKSAIDELKGGTFTVTNAGSIGGVFTTPVINHPEVAILGINAIRKRPMVSKDGQIVVRDMMYLSMSVDHRVVDGADAARFMNRLIYFLSEPSRLVFA